MESLSRHMNGMPQAQTYTVEKNRTLSVDLSKHPRPTLLSPFHRVIALEERVTCFSAAPLQGPFNLKWPPILFYVVLIHFLCITFCYSFNYKVSVC